MQGLKTVCVCVCISVFAKASLSPAAGRAAGSDWLAGWTEPLPFRDAVEHRPQAEEMEGLVALVTENQLVVLAD